MKQSEEAVVVVVKNSLSSRDTLDSVQAFSEEIYSTVDMMQYNPNFTMTPEVVCILRKCFNTFQVDENGNIQKKELLQAVQQLGRPDFSFDIYLNNDKNANEVISFDEFCDIVLHWKELSSENFEVLYQNWVRKYIPSSDDDTTLYSTQHSINPQKNDNPSSTKLDTTSNKLFSRTLIAGGLAGCFTKTCFAPIDRIKLIFQAGDLKLSLRNAYELGKTIYTRDGFRALFKGNAVMIFRAFPYAALQHSSYDYFKREVVLFRQKYDFKEKNSDQRVYGRDHKISNWEMIISGSLAGGVSVVCTYPLDVLRARFAVQQGKTGFKDIIGAYRYMHKLEGPVTFMRGLFPTLLGILPYTGIGFWLNDYFKHKLYQFKIFRKDTTDRQQLLVVPKVICGYTAGTIALAATYPLDTIRRRMQTDGYITSSGGFERRYTGTIQTARIIVKQEGIFRGLYKGISLSVIKAPLAIAVSLTTYDVFKELLGVDANGSH